MKREIRKRVYRELKSDIDSKVLNKVLSKIPNAAVAVRIEYINEAITLSWATELSNYAESKVVTCITENCSLSQEFEKDFDGNDITICKGRRIVDFRKLRMDKNNPHFISDIKAESWYYGYGEFEDCAWDIITGFAQVK